MSDVFFIGLVLVCFVSLFAFSWICERLMEK